eukprot:TRINITY_DN45397_c0_g2_i1.p1 TRINITY_DN45397_c0_g2~~TRINITY_DN45397_c0_g2_i1.p1  ORF type:complete len:191 (+),score=24.24 TRINITY_DN45397_c0_g2_i1:26-574(+)
MEYKGRVTFINDSKTFGFITRAGGADIFFHRSECEDGLSVQALFSSLVGLLQVVAVKNDEKTINSLGANLEGWLTRALGYDDEEIFSGFPPTRVAEAFLAITSKDNAHLLNLVTTELRRVSDECPFSPSLQPMMRLVCLITTRSDVHEMYADANLDARLTVSLEDMEPELLARRLVALFEME